MVIVSLRTRNCPSGRYRKTVNSFWHSTFSYLSGPKGISVEFIRKVEGFQNFNREKHLRLLGHERKLHLMLTSEPDSAKYYYLLDLEALHMEH